MKITNTTKSDIGIQPDMIVPAGGHLDGLDPEAIKALMHLPSVASYFESGALIEGKGDAPQESDTRATQIETIIGTLNPETDFTKGGKPEVDVINALIEGEPVTAAERDAVWARMNDGAGS
jgi:hypothetical protein